jgi:hypothetical protein
VGRRAGEYGGSEGGLRRKKIYFERLKKRAEWLFILDPGLNCANCNAVKAKTFKPRFCDLKQGCKIEDIASDIELNRDLNDFVKACGLQNLGLVAEAREIYERLGLLENIGLLFDLRALFHEYQKKRAQREAEKNKK